MPGKFCRGCGRSKEELGVDDPNKCPDDGPILSARAQTVAIVPTNSSGGSQGRVNIRRGKMADEFEVEKIEPKLITVRLSSKDTTIPSLFPMGTAPWAMA